MQFQVIKLNEVEQALRQYRNFRASSMVTFKDFSTNEYIILSHTTVIAKTDFLGRVIYFDNRYYSTTTSKYQKYITLAYNLDVTERTVFYKGDL